MRALILCCFLWVAALACSCRAQQVILQLAGSSAGSGPALSGSTFISINQTISLPQPGQYKCESLQAVENPDAPFYSVNFDISGISNGTVLTLYNASDCTQPMTVEALFQPSGPYTVIPGSIQGSASPGFANSFGVFSSLTFHVPLQGGIIEDGFYNLYTGPPTNDFSNDYAGCGQYLSGGVDDGSVTFATNDNQSGLQQFLLQLVKSPDHYSISIPRGRNGATALLSSPDCAANPQAVFLVNATDSTATDDTTTWVITSVTSTKDTSFGFLANITSLARLNASCMTTNATSLGIVSNSSLVQEQETNGTYDTEASACTLENHAMLIPGADVSFSYFFNNSTYVPPAGGLAILPVAPSYCPGNPYNQCYPGDVHY